MDDLKKLSDRIAAIQAFDRRPMEPGEERPYIPISDRFDEEDWKLLTRVGRAVPRDHRSTLNLFMGEVGLAQAVVHAIADDDSFGLKTSRLAPETIEELSARIRERVPIENWLVAIPIYNATLPAPLIELGETAVLVRADQELSSERWRDSEGDDPGWLVRRHFGEGLSLRGRWLHASFLPQPLDTRIGGYFVTVMEGTRSVVAHRAEMQAAHLLATWSLEAPPGFRRLWPSTGRFAPHAFLRFDTAIKSLGTTENPKSGARQSSSITKFSECDMPTDLDVLRRPWRAIEIVADNHPARALLSATWALHQAARDVELQLPTDLMFYAFTAIAALCENPQKPHDAEMFRRWDVLQSQIPNLERDAEEHGLGKEALARARQALHDARNIAAHGADAALVNLGYPESATRSFRGRDVEGARLAPASLYSVLRPSLWLARRALLHCWHVADETDFDPQAFEALLCPNSASAM